MPGNKGWYDYFIRFFRVYMHVHVMYAPVLGGKRCPGQVPACNIFQGVNAAASIKAYILGKRPYRPKFVNYIYKWGAYSGHCSSSLYVCVGVCVCVCVCQLVLTLSLG